MTASFESRYSLRIGRAQLLQAIHPCAAEILSFYEKLCGAQQVLASKLRGALGKTKPANGDLHLRERVDVDVIRPLAGTLLTKLAAVAPGPIAESIEGFLRASANHQA